MLKKIKEIMNDLMQRDCVCNYVIEQNGNETYFKNILATQAYMKAYEMSKNGDVKCYMASLGKENKAVNPIFSVINGTATLSGIVIE